MSRLVSSTAVVPNVGGWGGGGLNVTRTLQKSATKPDSQLILVIVHDWHSERGVHWTLRLIHVDARGHSAAVETSASVNTRVEQARVRSDEMNETRLKTTSRPGWSCENILYLFMTRNKPQLNCFEETEGRSDSRVLLPLAEAGIGVPGAAGRGFRPLA